MANWTTRPYRHGDEDPIRDLYESVFDLPKSREFWRWRYLDNPTGRVAILLAVSEEDSSLVGQYTLCPLAMKLGGQDVIGALSLDTMVHPAFRRQGMLTRLAEDLYRDVAEEGVPLVYGFPNEQSHHGLVKYLGWVDLVETLPIYVRPLDFSSLLRQVLPSEFLTRLAAPVAQLAYKIALRPRASESNRYTVSMPVSFDGRVDELWQQAREIAPILVRRDRDFLNWRYTAHPESDYTILCIEDGDALVGYSVLRIQELAGLQAGFVADLLVRPGADDAVDALLEAAVQHSQAEGCAMVNCLMLDHIPYVAALKRKGFMRAPARVMPQELYLGVRNNNSQWSDSFLQISSNWYITWGDHDRV